jgi:hypothetical protein
MASVDGGKNQKYFRMTIIQIGILAAIVLMVCAVWGIAVIMVFSSVSSTRSALPTSTPIPSIPDPAIRPATSTPTSIVVMPPTWTPTHMPPTNTRVVLTTPTLQPPTHTPTPTFTPLPTPTFTLAPRPTDTPAAIVVPPSQSAPRTCCKICTTGKACGNSCISRSYTCHQPPGCACNGY